MKKALDFNTYKHLRKMSFNDMNRWIRKFWDTAYQTGIDEAVENGVVEVTEQEPKIPENLTTMISNDDLFDLLVSIKGIGEKRANEIMDKMEEFGIDASLWEVKDGSEKSDGNVGDGDAPAEQGSIRTQARGDQKADIKRRGISRITRSRDRSTKGGKEMIDEELIKDNIESRKFEVTDTEIRCPYCGYSKNVEYGMTFGEDLPDVYTEGEEKIKCPECSHTFRLTKSLSWEYMTEIIEE